MLANWVQQTITTSGSGPLTLAAVSGYPTFYDVLGLQRRFAYAIVDDATGVPLESGIGYLSDAVTLVREKVATSFAGNTFDDTSPAAVALAAGKYRVISADTAEAIQGVAKGPNRALNMQRVMFSQHATHHNASSNGLALAANRLYLMPFWLTAAADVDALAARCGTGAAGSSVRMGLYDIGADGHPSKLLGETGALSSATGGLDIIGTISQVRLQPGWYFVAIMSSGAPTVGRIDNGGQTPCHMGSGQGNILLTYAGFIVDWPFGTLPNGNVPTSSTLVGSNTGVPALALRVVS